MSKEVKKGYRVPATILTLNNTQEYPIADMEDIAGGYHVVKTMTEMFNIPRLHRRVGMLCYVVNEDLEYRLIVNSGTNKTTLANWAKIARTGGEYGGGPVDLSNYVTKTMFEPVRTAVEGLPDMATMATKTDVQISKNNTINYINQKMQNVAYQSDIPDISMFLNQQEIENLIEFADEDVTQEEINNLFVTE